jgi:hypothetical protein
MNLRIAATTLLVSVVLTTGISAQTVKPTAATRAKVRKLLDLTGASSLGGQVVDSVIGDVRRNVPQVPDTFWKTFRTESKPASFNDRLVTVYEKHFTEAEIDELIRFYASPLGRRFVAKQPALAQESMLAARTFGQQVAQRAMQQLAAKGHIQKATKK